MYIFIYNIKYIIKMYSYTWLNVVLILNLLQFVYSLSMGPCLHFSSKKHETHLKSVVV